MLKLVLEDRRWQVFLAEHEDDAPWLEMVGTKENRETLLEYFDALGDIDIEVLRIFEEKAGREGWEYGAFREILKQRLALSSEREDPLARLEDCGLVDRGLCEDGGGTFVAIESARNEPARLLRALLDTDLLD
jgi:hypothetical protein